MVSTRPSRATSHSRMAFFFSALAIASPLVLHCLFLLSCCCSAYSPTTCSNVPATSLNHLALPQRQYCHQQTTTQLLSVSPTTSTSMIIRSLTTTVHSPRRKNTSLMAAVTPTDDDSDKGSSSSRKFNKNNRKKKKKEKVDLQ